MSLLLGTSGHSEYFWKLETCVNFWHVLCTARKTDKDRASGSFANGELCQRRLITFVRQQSAVGVWHVERIISLETHPANIRWYLIWSASAIARVCADSLKMPALCQTDWESDTSSAWNQCGKVRTSGSWRHASKTQCAEFSLPPEGQRDGYQQSNRIWVSRLDRAAHMHPRDMHTFGVRGIGKIHWFWKSSGT